MKGARAAECPAQLRNTGWVDPFSPIALRTEPHMRVQQWQRRATILSRTRKHLAQGGYAGVVMRDIAEESHVSIQTVYNLIGDKAALVGEAIAEYIQATGSNARASLGYPSFILALADAYWFNATRYSDFLMQATLSSYLPGPIASRVHDCATEVTLSGFLELRTNGLLRQEAPIREWARTIARMSGTAMLHGLGQENDLRSLRYSLLAMTGQFLIGAVQPPHAAVIEAWLDRTFATTTAH